MLGRNEANRFFVNNGDGSFTDTGAPISDGMGGLTTANQSTVFGWGSAIFDLDNDGDNDVIYHGGLDAGGTLVLSDNPGVVLINDNCTGQLSYDPTVVSADHLSRNVRGVAVGDLDKNGFVDVMTVANLRMPAALPLLPSPIQYGDPLDATALFSPTMTPVGTPENPEFVWNGLENDLGDLKLELNSGNGNGSAKVTLLGSVGLTADGSVNRDGIGALIRFRPTGGKTTMQAVVAGSSHSSQHAIEKVFGLGEAANGLLEVHWPGGVRNRLYRVSPGEDIVFPEIPCSFDGDFASPLAYLACVSGALDDLSDAGVISGSMRVRLLSSAIRAYFASAD